MTTNDNRHYKAAEGCLIAKSETVQVTDPETGEVSEQPVETIMGDSIDLGTSDSIENYYDKAMTAEEMAEFYRSIGMDDFGSDEL